MLMGAGLNRPERRKTEILAAARGVFLRQGYPDTGMEVVARMAGVSTATLYTYFPSKAKLFEVVIHETVRDMAGPVRASTRVKGDARARLMALTCAYATFFSRPMTRATFRLITSERRRFQVLADFFLRNAREELGRAAIRVIDDLVETGELKVEKPSWAAGQLLGMIDHPTLLLGLSAGDNVQPNRPLEELSRDAVETFLARYGNNRVVPQPSPARS
ncbi:TetR/AcrR family transcriptional regulator [Caulobacter sp. DWR3-1-2]|nr:TetR/AcrR family transcriptional regulator [Caulobacter sp.]